METIINKQSSFALSARQKERCFDLISYLFIMLFVYTAASKLMTHDSFVQMLGKSPALKNFNVLLSWLIPTVELIISGLLLLDQTKRIGMLLSLVLIVVFTCYLVYMVSLGVKLPCLCGGVVEMLSWRQHIFFNLTFILLAIVGLKLSGNKDIARDTGKSRNLLK